MAKVIRVPPSEREYHYICRCGATIEFGPEDVCKGTVPATECDIEREYFFVECPLCLHEIDWEDVQNKGTEVNNEQEIL